MYSGTLKYQGYNKGYNVAYHSIKDHCELFNITH